MSDRTPSGPLPDPDGDDELSPTARQLRDALAARAAGVQPADKLEEIRMASRSNRRRTRAWAAVAGVAAVVVVGGGAYALTQRGDDDVTTVATSQTTSQTTSQEPQESPGETTAASEAPQSSAPEQSATGGTLPTSGTAVPVYWLGGSPAKLFREYVSNGASENGAENDPTRALRSMLAGSPTDPDYSSPWSADESATVTESGGRLVVDLSAAAASGSTPDAETAIQQLVYTVTAAAGQDQPVQIRVDGAASPTIFGTTVAESLSRAPQADVQAPAWITNVTAASGQVTVEGVGTAFEGTLMYTITDAAGAEVTRNSVQAGANGTFAEFSFTAQVAPGSYTVAVYAPDESGGEGTPQVGDTKEFTLS